MEVNYTPPPTPRPPSRLGLMYPEANSLAPIPPEIKFLLTIGERSWQIRLNSLILEAKFEDNPSETI